MVVLYGIPNCSTVKKARGWLDAYHIHYQFYDFKKQSIDECRILLWLDKQGNSLINRKGTTWRQLSDPDKKKADCTEDIVSLLQEKPTLIKRPVLEYKGSVYLSFSESMYIEIFAHE